MIRTSNLPAPTAASARRFARLTPGRWVTAVSTLLMLVASILLPVQSASAAGPQVTVLYPHLGQLTSSPQESPPHHHYWGNFGIDIANPDSSTTVRARFANPTGSLTLSLI